MRIGQMSAVADFGVLILRLGIGFEMVVYGWPKIIGGITQWEHAGAALSAVLGIHFLPVVWGLAAALAQALGGAMVAIGIFTRQAAAVLAAVMGTASVMVFQKSCGDFKEWSHPAEAAVVFLAIVFIGSGRFGFDSSEAGS